MLKVWVLAGVLSATLCGAASADDVGAEDVVIEVEPSAPTVDERAAIAVEATPLPPYTPYNGRTAIDAWDAERGWRYGTEMLFPFTRGMEDAGVTGWARWPLGILTVPLDVALLPTGLIAGLWGG